MIHPFFRLRTSRLNFVDSVGQIRSERMELLALHGNNDKTVVPWQAHNIDDFPAGIVIAA
jgi:hypothetical protein